MTASGEDFDISWSAAGVYKFTDYVMKKAYLPLNNLLPKYAPKTWAMIPKEYFKATTFDGDIFGIPNYQLVAQIPALTINKYFVDKYNLSADVKKVKTINDIEPILAKLKKSIPEGTYIMGQMFAGHMGIVAGLESVGSGPGVVDMTNSKFEIVNQWKEKRWIEPYKLTRKWQEKGYIDKDLSLIKNTDPLWSSNKLVLSVASPTKPGGVAETQNRFGYTPMYAQLAKPYVSTGSVQGTLQTINAVSKNPERALMLIDLVNSDKELYNTLCFGIKDVTYKINASKKVEKIADGGYWPGVNWMIGNTLNAQLQGSQTPNDIIMTKQINKTARKSKVLGFTFDQEPVKLEVAQCNAVVDKYTQGLIWGLYEDVDGTISKMNQEMENAGAQKVLDEKQRQLTAWAKANKLIK